MLGTAHQEGRAKAVRLSGGSDRPWPQMFVPIMTPGRQLIRVHAQRQSQALMERLTLALRIVTGQACKTTAASQGTNLVSGL